MLPTTIAKQLSQSQRNVLIAHIDSPQPLEIEFGGPYRTKTLLLERGLLCATHNATRPKTRLKELRLSELGREVVCHVLGEYADFLIASGCLSNLTKSQLFDSIKKASQRRPKCDTTAFPAAATPTDTCVRNTLRNRAATLRLLSLLQTDSHTTAT